MASFSCACSCETRVGVLCPPQRWTWFARRRFWQHVLRQFSSDRRLRDPAGHPGHSVTSSYTEYRMRHLMESCDQCLGRFQHLLDSQLVEEEEGDESCHLQQSYGLKIADDRSRHAREDLVVRRRESPVYLRDNHDEVRSLFQQIIDRLKELRAIHGKPLPDSLELNRNCFFVNSPAIPLKLALIFPKRWGFLPEEAHCRTWQLTAGLCLLQVVDWGFMTPHQGAMLLKESLNRIGATPSIYQIHEFLGQKTSSSSSSSSSQQIQQSARLIKINASAVTFNIRLLVELTSDSPDNSTEESLSTLALRKAARAMYLELALRVAALSESPSASITRAKFTLFLRCLHHIEGVLFALSDYRQQLLRSSRLFELFSDDMFILVNILRPYDPPTLSHIAQSVFLRRYPIFDDPLLQKECFITSGGMDSLSSSLAQCIEFSASEPGSAPVLCIERLDPASDYVELRYLIDDVRHNFDVSPASPNVIAFLNLKPSVPIHPVCSSVPLAAMIRSRMASMPDHGRLSLICDITIETILDQQLLHDLFLDLMGFVLSGRLVLYFCKSYQKYATLGMAKVMAGSVIVVASGAHPTRPTVLSMIESSSQWPAVQDAQFLGHLLSSSASAELELISSAADHASLVHALWPSLAEGDSFVSTLPFVVKGKPSARWCFESLDRLSSKMHPLAYLCQHWISLEDRDSFSSLVSSFLAMDSVVRFNIGQESPRSLIEKFSALGPLLNTTSSPSALPSQSTRQAPAPLISFSSALRHLAVVIRTVAQSPSCEWPVAASSGSAEPETIPSMTSEEFALLLNQIGTRCPHSRLFNHAASVLDFSFLAFCQNDLDSSAQAFLPFLQSLLSSPAAFDTLTTEMKRRLLQKWLYLAFWSTNDPPVLLLRRCRLFLPSTHRAKVILEWGTTMASKQVALRSSHIAKIFGHHLLDDWSHQLMCRLLLTLLDAGATNAVTSLLMTNALRTAVQGCMVLQPLCAQQQAFDQASSDEAPHMALLRSFISSYCQLYRASDGLPSFPEVDMIVASVIDFLRSLDDDLDPSSLLEDLKDCSRKSGISSDDHGLLVSLLNQRLIWKPAMAENPQFVRTIVSRLSKQCSKSSF